MKKIMDRKKRMALRGKYLANRANVDPSTLTAYRGQWIVWNPEGTQINVHGDSVTESRVQTKQSGHDLSECVVEGIPDQDTLLPNISGNHE